MHRAVGYLFHHIYGITADNFIFKIIWKLHIFARFKAGNLAEGVGFEPTCLLRDQRFSRPPRCDHFGTPPYLLLKYLAIFFTCFGLDDPISLKYRDISRSLLRNTIYFVFWVG